MVSSSPTLTRNAAGRSATHSARWRAAFPLALIVAAVPIHKVSAQSAAPDGGGVRSGVLPRTWQVSGPQCDKTPQFQVHRYNPDLFVLRESGCSNYEKPFLYLFFGSQRALLLDTGAGVTDIGDVVGRIISDRKVSEGGRVIPLVVAHTHAHGDHIAGDGQFSGRSDVTVVAPNVDAVARFFGFKDWPNDVAVLDLGDRLLDVLGIPGHEPSSIALYDRQTGVLFTGDTLYPGRLYIRDASAFRASISRLVEFTAGKIVTHILGNHIEQTRTPYLDYPVGTVYQPDEHQLELGRAQLLELNAALGSMEPTLHRAAYRDFTIWPKD
jgi:glyoxylase-like metal-dependent hydrolase (beta-lactamase superfamily II)